MFTLITIIVSILLGIVDPAPRMTHSPAAPTITTGITETVVYSTAGSLQQPTGVVMILEYHVPGAEPPNDWGFIDDVDLQTPSGRTATTVTYSHHFGPLPHGGEYRVRAIAMTSGSPDVISVDEPIPVQGSGH